MNLENIVLTETKQMKTDMYGITFLWNRKNKTNIYSKRETYRYRKQVSG